MISEALQRQRAFYELSEATSIEVLAETWQKIMDDYGLCPLRPVAPAHRVLMLHQLPCMQGSCAIWNDEAKCCGLLPGKV